MISHIGDLAERNASLAMLSRTHGQPASPTTFGKEFAVFASRLITQEEMLENFRIKVKLNGASGNYCAHEAAFPGKDWVLFTDKFLSYLFGETMSDSYEMNFITTQIESHDTYAELFDNIRRLNVILLDFSQDMWRYISDEWVVQIPVEGEVGSSAMPHKVNPIDFENAEGNLGIANALFGFFSTKLPISRMQRDLSDSTVERNFGVAFSHTLIAIKSILKGLSKIEVSEENVLMALGKNPQVLAEAIQTILRREGLPMPYEQLKDLTRGKKVTMLDITKFIEGLDISDDLRKELHQLRPDNYTGIASSLRIG